MEVVKVHKSVSQRGKGAAAAQSRQAGQTRHRTGTRQAQDTQDQARGTRSLLRASVRHHTTSISSTQPGLAAVAAPCADRPSFHPSIHALHLRSISCHSIAVPSPQKSGVCRPLASDAILVLSPSQSTPPTPKRVWGCTPCSQLIHVRDCPRRVRCVCFCNSQRPHHPPTRSLPAQPRIRRHAHPRLLLADHPPSRRGPLPHHTSTEQDRRPKILQSLAAPAHPANRPLHSNHYYYHTHPFTHPQAISQTSQPQQNHKQIPALVPTRRLRLGTAAQPPTPGKGNAQAWPGFVFETRRLIPTLGGGALLCWCAMVWSRPIPGSFVVGHLQCPPRASHAPPAPCCGCRCVVVWLCRNLEQRLFYFINRHVRLPLRSPSHPADQRTNGALRFLPSPDPPRYIQTETSGSVDHLGRLLCR